MKVKVYVPASVYVKLNPFAVIWKFPLLLASFELALLQGLLHAMFTVALVAYIAAQSVSAVN